ncbi:tRNA1Val (adenine37-N6)-methyltransferase [Cricetibacter osteomyelitidis]|uniref:tRNA1(Val) (adenine(37)-N6)-methyltransferase n=1 Tax=Cricetibacter osteomyelitidis TaxID=1521931 RepID=A0A4R2SXP1_9PAST|nr:tRNA1(Val) (adenine(37)-N6)-methyltransferase [Cricetibacter osteomyelitidis]TCP93234.1 tRNA1Val (adenine37-N6)-methyltransferase [Cricetibacter osteomyelitidis]
MSGFTFKQFHINQDRCAMKVGTDGILLGSWANAAMATQILDLGSGTGLIPLMLAQRNRTAQISGVELDEPAFLQAKENIEQSIFADQICLYHQNIAEFAQKCGKKFDLITANPPYFAQGCDCRDPQRDLARYTRLSHLQWLRTAESLLTEQGKICFVLPFTVGELLKTQLKHTALFCVKQCNVITKIGKVPQRVLLEFARQYCALDLSELVIYNEQNQYTDEFVTLTKDFYLKF